MWSIAQKTDDWVKNGLISSDQAQHIVLFEKNKKSLFSFYSVMLLLGVFSIACGIVAVISSNWENISGAVKVVGLFISLITVCLFLLTINEKRPVVFQTVLSFYILLLFAAIGLVAQVYHLKSETYKAFLFWSILSFPLLCLSRKKFWGYVWEPIFAFSLLSSPYGREVVDFLVHHCIPFPLFVSFLSVMLFLAVFRSKKIPFLTQPLRDILFMAALMGLVTYIDVYTIQNKSFLGGGAIAFYILSLVSTFFLYQSKAFNKNEKKILYGIILSYLLYFIFMSSRPVNYFFQLFILINFIFTAYFFNAEKVARLLAVFTVARILFAFFSLFGSLIYTGIGMIVCGCVILVMAVVCVKIDAFLKRKIKKSEAYDE